MGGVFNQLLFGSVLRGLRQDRGFDRGEAFCEVVFRDTGLQISERSLYDIEKGRRKVSFPEVAAFVVVLRPDRGIHYFSVALDPDLADKFQRINCSRPEREDSESS